MLNKKEQYIFETIKAYMDVNKIPPSIREICELTNYKSTSTIHKYIHILVEKGYLKKRDDTPRGLVIVN